MTRNGSAYYLLYDQIGTLRAVADSSGTIVKQIDYDSFGSIIADTNPAFKVPFGFAGGLHDRDTGLVRFGARDYDPAIGRWTAKDPIDFAGGDANLYGYVQNNPVNLIDPEGLEERIIGSRGGQPLVYDTETRQYTVGYPNTNNTDSSAAWEVIKFANDIRKDVSPLMRFISDPKTPLLMIINPDLLKLVTPNPADAMPNQTGGRCSSK